MRQKVDHFALALRANSARACSDRLKQRSLTPWLQDHETQSFDPLGQRRGSNYRLGEPECLYGEKLPGYEGNSTITTCFPAKWRLRNERRNSILLTWHNPDLGSASDWSCRKGKFTPTKQKLHPDLGNDPSSVWNLRARFSKMTFSGASSLKIFHWPDHVDLELKNWGAVSH